MRGSLSNENNVLLDPDVITDYDMQALLLTVLVGGSLMGGGWMGDGWWMDGGWMVDGWWMDGGWVANEWVSECLIDERVNEWVSGE